MKLHKLLKGVIYSTTALLLLGGFGYLSEGNANAKATAPLDEMNTHVSLNSIYKNANSNLGKFEDNLNTMSDDDYFLEHNGKFHKHYANRYKNDLYKSDVISELADKFVGENVYSKSDKNGFKKDLPALKNGLRTRKEKSLFNFLMYADNKSDSGNGGSGAIRYELRGGHIYRLTKKDIHEENIQKHKTHIIMSQNKKKANKIKHKANSHSYQFKLGVQYGNQLNESDPFDNDFDLSLGKHLSNKNFKYGFLYSEVAGDAAKDAYSRAMKDTNSYEKLGHGNKAFRDGWFHGVAGEGYHYADINNDPNATPQYTLSYHSGWKAGHKLMSD